MTYSSSFLNMITSRGYLHQATNMDALDMRMSQQTISAYIGFDCTVYVYKDSSCAIRTIVSVASTMLME